MSLAPRWRRWPTTTFLLFPGAVVIIFGYHRRWITDDALIMLRVVEHLLAGHAPLSDDPLADIRHVSRIERVIARGQVHEPRPVLDSLRKG